MRDAIADWFLDNLGTVLVVMILGFLALIFVIAKDTGEREDAFMSECTKDHKQYECTAMWRAGERHDSTVVVPVVTR